MPHSALLTLSLLLVFAPVVLAEALLTQKRPTVVYEGRSTIPAQPYYQRLRNQQPASARRLTPPAGASVQALEDRLPLQPDTLRIGTPALKTVNGLVRPLFIMGMDDVSLNWFQAAAEGLVAIGAKGIVVQATDKIAWLDLKERARATGIDLILLEGDSIAEGYGVDSYPVVFVGPELAGQGAHE
jgi:integrating conjugative element protein (TIGR03765 family)